MIPSPPFAAHRDLVWELITEDTHHMLGLLLMVMAIPLAIRFLVFWRQNHRWCDFISRWMVRGFALYCIAVALFLYWELGVFSPADDWKRTAAGVIFPILLCGALITMLHAAKTRPRKETPAEENNTTAEEATTEAER